jgi:hypothetical protein
MAPDIAPDWTQRAGGCNREDLPGGDDRPLPWALQHQRDAVRPVGLGGPDRQRGGHGLDRGHRRGPAHDIGVVQRVAGVLAVQHLAHLAPHEGDDPELRPARRQGEFGNLDPERRWLASRERDRDDSGGGCSRHQPLDRCPVMADRVGTALHHELRRVD